jgi:hypothetical protein
MISHSEWQRRAVELGYNVHGDESGEVRIPDLTHYMPEIAHAFEEYLRHTLPEIFAGGDPEFMNEERVEGIVAEVYDHLMDDPPNMAAVLDIAEQLNISDESRHMMMEDMKNYMNSMIIRILEDMGYPRGQIEQAAASMAYALGSLSDKDYMMAMGGAFGGADMGAMDEFLNNTYEMPDVERISYQIYEEVTNYMYENLPSLGLDDNQV